MSRKFLGVFICRISPEEVRKALESDPNICKWAYVFHESNCGRHCHVYIEVVRNASCCRRDTYFVKGLLGELERFYGYESTIIRYFSKSNGDASPEIVANFDVKKYLV